MTTKNSPLRASPTALSGTEQGAGGVGGLLAVSVDGQYYFPCSDHNGNVMAYVSESGAIVAQYTYTPFGEVMSAAGPMAGVFRFRFSTKYQDEATGLYYYGYRFYDPAMMRFISRDPIGEQGGLNLYGFVGNDPVNRWDYLGMWSEPNRRGGNWASICAQDGDSWGTLANKLGLDNTQASIWVRNYENTPKPGKYYHIPNAVVLYLAKPEYYLRMEEPMDIPFLPDGADITRALARLAAQGVRAKGYKLHSIESNSRSELIRSWGTKGIWAFIFGGHGVIGQLVTSPKKKEGVFASDVAPPYKLGLVALFACESAIGEWQEKVPSNGIFFGYRGKVAFFSAHQIEVSHGK